MHSDDLPAVLQQVRHASFDVELGRDVQLDVRIRSESAEDADLLRQSILGSIAGARLAFKDRPEMMALLVELQVSHAGRDVDLSAIVTEDMLLDLREKILVPLHQQLEAHAPAAQ